MGTRSRVFSFMSNFGNKDSQRSPTPTSSAPTKQDTFSHEPARKDGPRGIQTPTSNPVGMDGESSQPRVQRERAYSRPVSMIQTYQPPMMDVSQDTLPELQPIFTFLNSHANKLYQEGYFLKLDDQNTHGRPNADRTWTECFAQLVGTVLSLWDAAELDAAGQDGEVLPKFINLTDASIKMIESLPTRSDTEAPLQNVLSISTAGKNRYLLHFNSHHSLIQWTAGIRLSMFEHAGLQEAYTGALIAGKGKALNNINIIMDRAKLPTADWARVRFGAGTPWRRCWCVITPPDEKEVQKLQKQVNKKKSAYDRSRPPILKGDIKFYDSKRTKKIRPIATINDAYSAFAIYPQSKPLIDASTLVKVEGSITIHSNPPTTTEGFVFVMPEVHPAVTGFEMMLRWLFPVFDTFGLYGRPGRLVPDTSDIRSLMFAMPKHRRYGYLEILDVSGLILEPGSTTWKESEWRKRMKELTGKRMIAIENGSRTNSRYSSRRSTRNSFGPSRSRIQFDDTASVRSSPSLNWGHGPTDSSGGVLRTDSVPPDAAGFAPQKAIPHAHHRSVSETQGLDRFQNQSPASNYDGAYDSPPAPPPHAVGTAVESHEPSGLRYSTDMGTPDRISSEDEGARRTPVRELQDLQSTSTPEPVAAPPAFTHAPGTLPISKPYHSPDLRRANSRMSTGTLSQLAGAGGVAAAFHAVPVPTVPRTSEDQRRQNTGQYSEEHGQRGVLSKTTPKEYLANQDGLNEGLVAASARRFSFEQSSSNNETFTNTSQPRTTLPFNPSNLQHSQGHTNVYHTSEPYRAPYTYSHNSNPSVESTTSTSSQVSRPQTSPSILRKPLPTRTSSFQTPSSAEAPSSIGSVGQPIDQTAFDMIGRDHHHMTPVPGDQIRRHDSGGSVYDDFESTASPDYASTRRSFDMRESIDRPRAGVMRTVGDAEPDSARSENPINIDFGPAFNLASGKTHARPEPFESTSQSYGGGGSTMSGFPPRHPSPSKRPQSSGHAKSSSRNVISPDHMRTVAWQPGMATSANISAGQSKISPEQFVHQRAAVAATSPHFAHHRQQSSATLAGNQAYGRGTPTPPLVQNRPGDYLAKGHSRNNSSDLPQRPNSRGAGVALTPLGSGDITSALSAREQEHIARMTKQPLINMAHNNRPQAAPVGLIGAIDAREKDKAQMKKGINSQAVEHAIAQRQQQPDQGDYRSQAQYGNMGQYPQQYPVRGQSQQQYMSPAANVYGQGGGWSVPSPGYSAPEQGRQSPSQFPPRNQSYFQPSQPGAQQSGQYGAPPGTQGRGNQSYRGQGI